MKTIIQTIALYDNTKVIEAKDVNLATLTVYVLNENHKPIGQVETNGKSFKVMYFGGHESLDFNSLDDLIRQSAYTLVIGSLKVE